MEAEAKKQLMVMAMENHQLLKDPKKSTVMMADNELKQIEDAMSIYVKSVGQQHQQNPADELDSNAKEINEVVKELLKEHKAGKQSKKVDGIVEQIKKSDEELLNCRKVSTLTPSHSHTHALSLYVSLCLSLSLPPLSLSLPLFCFTVSGLSLRLP